MKTNTLIEPPSESPAGRIMCTLKWLEADITSIRQGSFWPEDWWFTFNGDPDDKTSPMLIVRPSGTMHFRTGWNDSKYAVFREDDDADARDAFFHLLTDVLGAD